MLVGRVDKKFHGQEIYSIVISKVWLQNYATFSLIVHNAPPSTSVLLRWVGSIRNYSALCWPHSSWWIDLYGSDSLFPQKEVSGVPFYTTINRTPHYYIIDVAAI